MPPLSNSESNAWFAKDVLPHEPMLRGYLKRSFSSVQAYVDDLVQETYLRLWKARASQPIRSEKSFLFHVARHLATDLVRHESAAPLVAVADLAALPVYDGKPNAAEHECTREEIALLAEAIDALPKRCREVFILRKVQRLPQKEIARILGIAEPTVEVQVQRGMKRCEAFFAAHGL